MLGHITLGKRRRPFTFSGKPWKVEDIRSQIENGKHFVYPNQSYDIGNGLIKGVFTAAEIETYCSISKQNCSKYKKSVLDGVTRHMKAGQPAFISPECKDKVEQVFSAKKAYLCRAEGSDKSDSYKKQIIDIINEGRSDKGFNSISTISRPTLRSIEKKCNLKKHACEVGTAARMKACASIFHALTFAAANKLHVRRMRNAAQLGNTDGLSVETTGNTKETKCITFGSKKEGQNYKVAPDPENPGEHGLLFSAKMMRSGCACGYEAKNVFILADARMEAEEFDPYEVSGLGQGTDVNSTGYVCFAKTRCGNISFYLWYWKEVLLPFIASLRAKCAIKEDEWFFWTEDGEAAQIECFNDPAFVKLLRDAKVHVAKGGASATEIEQPCDIDNKHKAIKAVNKNLNMGDWLANTQMTQRIATVVKNQETKYLERGKLPSTFLNQASKGLTKLWTSIEMTNRLRTTRNGFIKTGQINDGPMVGGFHDINFLQMINNLKTDKPISKEMFLTLEGKVLPECVAIMRRSGEISDAYLRALFLKYGLLHEEDDLDKYVVNRRRTIILTDPTWIDEEMRKEEEKVAQAEARQREKVVAAEEREANKIAAAVAKEARRVALLRKAEEKRVADQLKALEKANKANNPPSSQKRQIQELQQKNDQLRAEAFEVQQLRARIAELEAQQVQQPAIKKRKVIAAPSLAEGRCSDESSLPPAVSIKDQVQQDWQKFLGTTSTVTTKRMVHIGQYCSSAVCLATNDGVAVDQDNAHRYKSEHQHLCAHRHLCKKCWINRSACSLCNPAM
jgi:hypothetical protein